MESTEQDLGVPSVNVQVAAGVICVGLWMMGINRKMRIIIDNQRVLAGVMYDAHENISFLADQSATVRDVVRLVATTEKGTGI